MGSQRALFGISSCASLLRPLPANAEHGPGTGEGGRPHQLVHPQVLPPYCLAWPCLCSSPGGHALATLCWQLWNAGRPGLPSSHGRSACRGAAALLAACNCRLGHGMLHSPMTPAAPVAQLLRVPEAQAESVHVLRCACCGRSGQPFPKVRCRPAGPALSGSCTPGPACVPALACLPPGRGLPAGEARTAAAAHARPGCGCCSSWAYSCRSAAAFHTPSRHDARC